MVVVGFPVFPKVSVNSMLSGLWSWVLGASLHRNASRLGSNSSGFFEGGTSNSTILNQDRPKHKPRYMLVGFLFFYFQGCFRQLLVNCWFGARWFGYLGSPYERDGYLGVPLESQTINPNQQLAISWSNRGYLNGTHFVGSKLIPIHGHLQIYGYFWGMSFIWVHCLGWE